MKKNHAIIIHGGSGNIDRAKLSDSQIKEYKNDLDIAKQTSFAILDKGGNAMEAVCQAICILEDSPIFNAGKGSVFNAEGEIEMDASIMNGKNLKAGAICNVKLVRNPILLANKVLEESEHILLNGQGALNFAREHRLKLESKEYFETEKRRAKYLLAKERNQVELDHDEKMGTVGAVAIDKEGNIAAGTSTGGVNFKKYNRIGDSPIIGSGTYANNSTCGISCTGLGEHFIITSAAHEVSALMKYKNLTLKEAIAEVIFEQIVPLGGRGGIIGVDHYGNVEYGFSTTVMFRALKSSNGEEEVKIFK